ncbi:MAG TPA: hypothetical protein VGG83_28565 [Trebonia sp.]|jgi:hypothetical protein
MPTSTATTPGNPTPSASKSKSAPTKTPTKSQSPTAPPTATGSATGSATDPAQGGSATDPTQGAAPPTSAGSAPATGPATPTQTPSQGVARTAAFTATCAAHASTSAPGCGSWDAGASSGQAQGFAAGQKSSANLFDVNQDPWSGSQGAQVLTASSFQDWSVTATDSDPSNSPGEVLTYPDASVNYYQVGSNASQYDLNNITSLTSDFAESMPQVSNLDAEAAYDMWLNNWQTEVMVWVDTSPGKDRNLADSGDTEVGTYSYDGQNFSLWRNGSGITGFYIFLLDHSETSGTVDLKAMLETLVSQGQIPATSPLTEIPFGWEISDTGGKPVTFSLSKFDVNLQN